MVYHRTQKSGPGGGAGGLFKLERIKLILTGKCIAVDLRGAQVPTPKPRPHVPVLYRAEGYTAKDLAEVEALADRWMYSRNIGVLSRVVLFTIDNDWEEVLSPRMQTVLRSRVEGEQKNAASRDPALWRRARTARAHPAVWPAVGRAGGPADGPPVPQSTAARAPPDPATPLGSSRLSNTSGASTRPAAFFSLRTRSTRTSTSTTERRAPRPSHRALRGRRLAVIVGIGILKLSECMR
ncbi:hypothetical protein M885DRAFT_591385, partial [Pelagophyceae sp. CCMP2097]